MIDQDLARQRLIRIAKRYDTLTVELEQERLLRAAAIRDAVDAGMSRAQVGRLIGLSRGRIAQMLEADR